MFEEERVDFNSGFLVLGWDDGFTWYGIGKRGILGGTMGLHAAAASNGPAEREKQQQQQQGKAARQQRGRRDSPKLNRHTERD